ncbi:MAG: hypothetical protein IJI24_04740, partial [Lachnospiraceae bacterium]|nr:hypothetical protein [Lachnospiraceae bacterium]
MDSNQYGQLVFLALGIYCIYKGIMVLTTGKLTAREETKLRSYSENGIRRYKMVSAVTNIFGGIMICAVSIIRMLNLIDTRVYRII